MKMGSKTPSMTEDGFRQAMTRLQSQYRISNDKFGSYCFDFRKLAEKIGLERFEMAVTRAIEERVSAFAPTVAEFRSYVPAPVDRRQYCARCSGTHWLKTRDDLRNNPQMMRCPDCDHLPAKAWEPTAEDYRHRQEHPEEYWGEPDMLALLREQGRRIAANEEPIRSAAAAQAFILATRKSLNRT
jgi:hypothetical protein